MEKICIVLEIPALKEELDLLLPDSESISQVTKLISDAVRELAAGSFVPTGREILCRKEGSMLLHPGYSLAEYGITNGEHLLLF